MRRIVLSLILFVTTLFLVAPTRQANPVLLASLSTQQNCSGISVFPTSSIFLMQGGIGGFHVNNSTSCHWAVNNFNPEFITLTSINTSTGFVDFSVASNPGGPREGLLRVVASDNLNGSGINITVSQNGVAPVSLYRYWNPSMYNHFYTTNFGIFGSGGGGYTYQGVQCHVYASQIPGTVPLKHYYCADNGDHFYTTNPNEPGSGLPCYQYQGIECYVFTGSGSGRVRLYRYYEPNAQDHFYTTNFNELGNGAGGWYLEGVQCYVLP